MDPTLYDEISRGLARARGAAVEIKPSLSLDFANFPLKRERVDGLLVGSCDLELPSPELERLLLQQAYETTTTTDPGASGSLGTPTTQILFPKSVTEEQEAYARGFIDALEQLHRSQGAPVRAFGDDARHSSGLSDPGACNSVISTQPHSSLQNGLAPAHFSYVVKGGPSAAHSYSATIHHMATGQMLSSAPLHSGGAASSVPVSSAPFHSESSSAQAHFHSSQMGALVEAPQTVPRLGDTPPLSPVNMDDQERIKLERKRARNRMAARKCRSRKLEQIATLEIRVNELKSQNAVLASSASTLKGEVDCLEQQLHEHTMSGLCYANPNVPTHV